MDEEPSFVPVTVSVENVKAVAAGWTFDATVLIAGVEFYTFNWSFTFTATGPKLRPPQTRRPDCSWVNAISFPEPVLRAISDAFAETVNLPGVSGGGRITL